MSKGIDGEPICEMDTEDGFTEVQFVFRAYLMPFTYLFGIIANTINVIIFSHKKMRNQLVNWFFLILSISDIFVLFSSFFVFSLPVYAEYSGNAESLRISAVLIVYFYPIAQTSLTMSVYLTILVSTHRYLGVCHPFLIRRISNRSVVRGVIIFAIVFAISFNIPRWSELTYMPCSHKDTKKETLVVIPTEFMIGPWYTLIYRNAAYTIVMFFLPFAVLIMLNVRIVNTLRMSNRLRRQMTIQQTACKSSRFPGIKPSETGILEKKKLSIKSGTLIVPERRDHGVTIMLVAMTCEFLLFNLLAFANNMLELTGATSGNSRIETFLVEISSLLVNINGASTIVVYMIFGSKYRAIFLKWIAGSKFTRLAVQAGAPSFFSLGPNETTQLITNASTYDRTRGRR
ncbi:unnamed protein product, partial [Mesorhabditis belari]|uniref:G-protein coupled receptors family 1 profile domain-containing protein n=1 Tax=Mesorhabditis belari TaxID=2138241 RepID=A0AAF3FDA0_9BILA